MAEFPRELTPEERDILDVLVEANDNTGRLRQLLADTKVTGECRCGCGSLELSVDEKVAEERWPYKVWSDFGIRFEPLPIWAEAQVDGNHWSANLHVAREDAQLEILWGGPEDKGKRRPRPPRSELRAVLPAGDGQASR
jgi:hypothetical protein